MNWRSTGPFLSGEVFRSCVTTYSVTVWPAHGSSRATSGCRPHRITLAASQVCTLSLSRIQLLFCLFYLSNHGNSWDQKTLKQSLLVNKSVTSVSVFPSDFLWLVLIVGRDKKRTCPFRFWTSEGERQGERKDCIHPLAVCTWPHFTLKIHVITRKYWFLGGKKGSLMSFT